jgi:hypothetical protein
MPPLHWLCTVLVLFCSLQLSGQASASSASIGHTDSPRQTDRALNLEALLWLNACSSVQYIFRSVVWFGPPIQQSDVDDKRSRSNAKPYKQVRVSATVEVQPTEPVRDEHGKGKNRVEVIAHVHFARASNPLHESHAALFFLFLFSLVLAG